MNVRARLDQRWRTEIDTLAELASRSGGRLRLRSASTTCVQLKMQCISAFVKDGEDRPAVYSAWHSLSMSRGDAWPAIPIEATHHAPTGIWHPNIAMPSGVVGPDEPVAAMQQLLSALRPGVICYGDARPETRLVDVTLHIYNMLGYRFGAFSRAGEHLNLAAVVWANEALRANPTFFPLERRPLIAATSGGVL